MVPHLPVVDLLRPPVAAALADIGLRQRQEPRPARAPQLEHVLQPVDHPLRSARRRWNGRSVNEVWSQPERHDIRKVGMMLGQSDAGWGTRQVNRVTSTRVNAAAHVVSRERRH